MILRLTRKIYACIILAILRRYTTTDCCPNCEQPLDFLIIDEYKLKGDLEGANR